jgi:N,N-dimethylformamidase
MLIGYVSDELYLALHDVSVEFLREGRSCATVRSTPRGAVYAELEPGSYDVELARDGYGAKRLRLDLPLACPTQFRLLSDRLAGYMWPKWVRSGGTSEYCIHAAEECRVSLWRYGQRKEFVRLVSWHGEHGPRAGVQLSPDGDYTQTGVAWNRVGYDAKHHSMRVTAPERSGLYYLHLEGASGATFGFPWVVAPARPSAGIAVLAATNTWNAYNNFGGRSNYIHPTELPERPTMNARLELDRYRPDYVGYAPPNEAYRPLSFQRPERFNHVPFDTEAGDPIRGRQECHTAPAEWRLLAWLEREGFDYDLWSEAQLHHGELDLDAYRTLIVAVHPEYWSTDMYWRVKSWVDERGGTLAYLGGNGICGAVEFVQDGTALRFLNHADGSGRSELGDERFAQHAEAPARLTGLTFDDRGIMTSAPFRVLKPDHWAFEGTGLREGDLFGVASLHERVHGGASGHETDKVAPEGVPPGLVHLARGTNPDDGGADIAWHRTPSGGEVFAAGSITYVASLLVDEPLSRVTANVLRRFGTRRAGGDA